MKWNMKAIAIGILSLFIAPPGYATVSEAEQIAVWRSQLLRSYCAENWTEALSLAGALMGSEVTPHERVWLYLLRQDMFNYQSGVAEFNGCDGSPIAAGITGQADSDWEVSTSGSSLNWNHVAFRNGFSVGSNSVSSAQSRAALTASVTDIERGRSYDLYNWYAVGSVTNNSTDIMSSVRVVYEVYRRVEGYLELVETGQQLVGTTYLLPGETAPFDIGFDRGQVVKISLIDALESQIRSNACYPREDCNRPVRAANNTQY
jgi:hypothetical protein